ncbi:MAG: phosphoribosylformylglycinamidine cyclo-ligase [Mahellales bacterium]|jgi:phosphoribosylformylglycinamidine cyclo-ligase
MAISYEDSGVDIHAGYKAVELMKKHVASTYNKNVLGGIGSFSGLYALDTKGIKQPVLVAGADGVGTKLKIAFLMDIHNTIGQDCVAMCVNDIICQGAYPLFFLDYIATGKQEPEKMAAVVEGVAAGCVQAGCALIGGETAEMPGFYKNGEYDLAGFAVGMVDRDRIITGSDITKGDILIGLSSSGLHSNGYSLVRRLMVDNNNVLDLYSDDLGCTYGQELLKPTRIYVKDIFSILKKVRVKGIAHITGGGFVENIPRMLPEGLKAIVHRNSWEIPPIFSILKAMSGLEDIQLFNTFNMGIGMVLAVDKGSVDDVLKIGNGFKYNVNVIGEIVEGETGVDICQ